MTIAREDLTSSAPAAVPDHVALACHNVSIIVPAFDEAAAIVGVVTGLLRNFPAAEVIVIDDGSADKTGELARAAGARVLRHPQNCGYGASLRTGIENAARDYVLFCDADGQHTPEDVARVIQTAISGQFDMVVGARSQESHMPLRRRPGKLIMRWFANYLANRRIPDLNSGLRIIRRRVILRYLHLMPRGFSFSTTSTMALMKSGHSVHYIPITTRKRVGASSVRQWKHGPQALMLMLRLAVLFEPLRVFLTVAAGLGLLTMVSSANDIIQNHRLHISPTTIILSLATLQVFLFGLLCEQISALRREHHDSHH